MASWAKPGVKCECIDGGDWYDDFGYETSGPRKGDILTVATHPFMDDGLICIRFMEWPNGDDVFVVSHFRPIITQEQDTEMFLRIANDTPFHVMIDEEATA